MNLRNASIAGYVILTIAMIGLLARKSLFATGLFLILVQCLAVCFMLWARVTFGGRSFHAGANPTQGGLVTSGPYRFVRHPIYASIFYFLLASICSHPAVINFELGFIAVLAITIRIYAEEKLLMKQYPEYKLYAARTKRILPFIL